MPITPATPIARSPRTDPVLCLILEGLRPEDLSRAHSPFLDSLWSRSRIRYPLFGAPGEQCWGEVFSGIWPDHTGALSSWTLNPTEGLPLGTTGSWMYRGLEAISVPLHRQFPGFFTRRQGQSRSLPPPPLVNRALRHSIHPVDDPGVFIRPGRAVVSTLFDSIVAAGGRVEHTAFPTTPREEKRWISRMGFMSRAFLDRYDLYLARLPGGDRLTLSHGPGSPERHQLVRDLDGLVERLVYRFRRQWLKGDVLIASVRGTVATQRYFDAARRIHVLASQFGLRPLVDYAVMVNRTLVRAWALSGSARSVFPMIAEEDREFQHHGTVLTPEIARRHRLPVPGSPGGDWIWMAYPGVVVYPNDFDLVRPRAAFGYLSGSSPVPRDSSKEAPTWKSPDPNGAAALASPDHGFVIVDSPVGDGENRQPGSDEIAWRADLSSTLAKVLGVRIPSASRGRNLVDSER